MADGTAGAGRLKDAAGRTGQEVAGKAAETAKGAAGAVQDLGQGLAGLPTDRLKQEVRNLLRAAGERMLNSAGDRIAGLTGRLTDYAESGGKGLLGAVADSVGGGVAGEALKGGLTGGLAGGLKGALKGLFSKGGKGGKGEKGGFEKVTNIVETIDVGAPRRLVYNQWTMFQDFPSFMKKVENVSQDSDEELTWKAQVFWSHRNWKAHIVEQLPDQRIIWRSEGAKGYVDGAVTFHEVTPDLTRILLVLEYHPQGLFEKTGNLWRAQGRRARLELKHFRRHVMSHLLLHPEQVGEGWRGEIRDGEVVKDHETALREEQEAEEAASEGGGEKAAEEHEEAEPEQAEPEEAEPDEEEAEEKEPEEEEGEEEEGEEERAKNTGAKKEDSQEEEPQEEKPKRRSASARRSERGSTRQRERPVRRRNPRTE
ncbi:SRPBCC family protein [Nonomuraea cavernae]|uniref:SRPBCC family protein n=1 Tax=Nonomuraea cavernae TaxID=2045107 RepID=UPI0033D25ACD